MPPGFAPLPGSYVATRDALHRVAVHVLARRRNALTGRFGLRPSPGGFATAAAGPEHERLRTSDALLVRERTGETATMTALDLSTATLGDAADFAEVDLTAPLDVGHDTPPVGDADATLQVDPLGAVALASWFAFGASVLDAVAAAAGPGAGTSVPQIWPEHFDLGCDLAAGDVRTNLGASPGDGFHATPYLYVGPWSADRPGDATYWNAPFGAVLTHEDLAATPDPRATAIAFLERGRALLLG